jgi:CheY-like chemotaxis protein
MKPSPLILLIDDSAEIIRTLKDFFVKCGYRVINASNGLEGLNLLETHHKSVDLVITDLIMPHVSGVGVIAISKKKYPHLPVIAITGWGEYPEALASEAHADIVIEKPFELAALNQAIKDLLDADEGQKNDK